MAVQHDLATRTDGEIRTWIENHHRLGVTDTALFRALVEEHTRRFGKGFTLETSLAHLIAAAKAHQLTTPRAVAEANGIPWSRARTAMNGQGRYLDQLLDICRARGLPLLTALCVSHEGVKSGEPGAEALEGFVKAVERLGYDVSNAETFLRQCQAECFAWASTAA